MSLQGLEDEQKELLVGFHSKQLAIAHGIRSTSCKMWKMSKKNCFLVSIARGLQLLMVSIVAGHLFGT